MDIENLIKEINYKAIRSSGPGGQHVNKVSSKIELSFDVENSNSLSSDEKELLFKNLGSKLTKNNVLILTCDENRSQHRNKEIITKRFTRLILRSLIIPKKRKPTSPTKTSKKNRLEKKKRHAQKKALRNKPGKFDF